VATLARPASGVSQPRTNDRACFDRVRIVAGRASRHGAPAKLDPISLFAALNFLLAGFIKGVIGLGLPTIAMGLLAVAMGDVVRALAPWHGSHS